ncbi:hypothetical protein FACS189419_03940 [Planctomycetales bacterium]|nr:hypothetical protein FACS189419_03940 [Planctomycetales bacterium]
MQTLHKTFTFCFLLGVLVVANPLQADDEGMKLFLNASRVLNKTDSPIKSIFMEVDSSHVDAPPSEELLQKEINAVQAAHQQYINQISDANLRSNALNSGDYSLENTTKLIRGKYGKRKQTRSRYLIATDTDTIKMKLQYSTLLSIDNNPNNKKWSDYWTTLYERPLFPVVSSQRRINLRWIADRREAHLENGGSAGMEKLFIGRIQGSIANSLFELCPFDSDTAATSFIEKEIGVPRIAESSVEYEKDCYAAKVEIRRKDRLVASMLIDSSSGYTCPLMQIYNAKTNKLQEEYRSQDYFLHEQSGLWFPARCTEKVFDAKTGKLLSTTEEQVNPATLSVNQPVSPNEFAVDITEDALIRDGTQGEPRRYRAEKAGVLSLASGGLDLDKKDWLYSEAEAERYVPSQGGASVVVRWILIVSGAVLILIACIRLWRKKKPKPPLI